MRVRPCLWKVRLGGTVARSAYDQNGVGLTDIYSLDENIDLMHCEAGVAQLKTDAEMIVRCCQWTASREFDSPKHVTTPFTTSRRQ
jgi:hypothetical protein